MATRYAIASGNWSNAAIWDGGVSVPTSSDDVYANGFTVTINGTYTVLSIRNTSNAAPVIAAGGQFIYANGGSLTCTAAQAIYAGSTTAVLEMTLASPNTASFSGSVQTLTNTTGYNAIKLSGTGTLSCTGTYAVDNGSAQKQIINVTGAGTLNVIGNLSSTIASQAAPANTLLIAANATVNVTGNVTGAAGIVNTGTSATINISSTSTLNVTGTVTGSATAAIYTIGTTVNIIGNINGGTSMPGLMNTTAAATITLTGTATASSTNSAILVSIAYTTGTAGGTLVKVSGNPVNSTNIMAIIAPRITIDTSTSSWLFQISTGGNRTLYAAGVALGNPATSNVRSGTVYGASSELTGTLAVPSPSNVLSGVATDATVGTLLMTPAQFWNYLIASGFTAGSIGERLQNASTVATTGSQIASYNI